MSVTWHIRTCHSSKYSPLNALVPVFLQGPSLFTSRFRDVSPLLCISSMFPRPFLNTETLGWNMCRRFKKLCFLSTQSRYFFLKCKGNSVDISFCVVLYLITGLYWRKKIGMYAQMLWNLKQNKYKWLNLRIDTLKKKHLNLELITSYS